MCLRNTTREVCNDTELIVHTVHNHLLDCEILTGPGEGKSISLPTITLIDNSKEETVILKRRQFPVALVYAMTFDESQGQSLEYTGLILTRIALLTDNCTPPFLDHWILYNSLYVHLY
jgi:hypothetical protein